jgi:hypothetical protein
MGGHNGWRKRVRNGLLAKEGGGGNIARHRPRFGRQGIIVVPKKGDSNPKKKVRIQSKETHKAHISLCSGIKDSSHVFFKMIIIFVVFLIILFKYVPQMTLS